MTDQARPSRTTGAEENATTGIVLLVLITIFWGINWPAIKLSVNEVPAWTFRTICLLAGTAGLSGVAATAGPGSSSTRSPSSRNS